MFLSELLLLLGNFCWPITHSENNRKVKISLEILQLSIFHRSFLLCAGISLLHVVLHACNYLIIFFVSNRFLCLLLCTHIYKRESFFEMFFGLIAIFLLPFTGGIIF